MNRVMIASALLTALAAPSFAGGPTVIADGPVPTYAPAPAAAHDWSGPYIGLGYGKASGPLVFTPGFSLDLESGGMTSIFAGYLMQRGSMVYGGEIASSRGKEIFPTGYPEENLREMLDVKAKLGYASNRALIYGVLGYSKLVYDLDPGIESFSTSGLAYGLGVDFAVTNSLTMGLEYLARRTDGETDNPGQTADIDLNSLQLRVGFSF